MGRNDEGYLQDIYKRFCMSDQEIKPCVGVHKVDGVVPTEFDERFIDRVCDCGRIVFYKDPCGCPGTPGWRLKSKPSEEWVQKT